MIRQSLLASPSNFALTRALASYPPTPAGRIETVDGWVETIEIVAPARPRRRGARPPF